MTGPSMTLDEGGVLADRAFSDCPSRSTASAVRPVRPKPLSPSSSNEAFLSRLVCA